MKEQSGSRSFLSPSQLSEASGVSTRTLRHYESLGLLCPTREANGYRAYLPKDVDRLQQILLYRNADVPLRKIKRILDDPSFDELHALKRHRENILAELDRKKQLLETIERTIEEKERGIAMDAKDKFEGMKKRIVADNEAMYGKEARELWGDEAIDAANERVLSWNESEASSKDELENEMKKLIAAALAEGKTPDSDEGAAVADLHRQWLQLWWGEGSYSPAAHVELAKAYLADERFTAYYEKRGEGTTRFLVDAIVAAFGDR